MTRTKPPFRADHVGSLLRPAALKQARAKREKGEIGAAELKALEDREIEKIIAKQQEIGLSHIISTGNEAGACTTFASQLDSCSVHPTQAITISTNRIYNTDTHELYLVACSE